MKKYWSLLFGIALAIIILFIYGGIFKTFYQQDEWLTLGHIMIQGYSAFIAQYSLFDLLGGQGRIFAAPVHFSIFYFFPFSIFPFALFSISLHIVNSFFAFLLVRKLSKNNVIAVVTALFFAISNTADQAIIWVAGASTTTLPVALFVFLSLIFYLLFLENTKKKYYWLAFSFAIIASYFKENGLFLFVLLPLLFLMSNKKINKKTLLKTAKVNWILIAFLLIVSTIKINFMLSRTLTGRFSAETGSAKEKIIYHAFLYPITSFSQMYINQGQMFSFSARFQRVFYSYLSKSDPNPLVAEFVVADMLSILLTFVIAVIMALIFFIRKNYRETILFGLLFTALSFFPYIVIDKANAYFESRYYYVSLLGGGLFLGIFIDFIISIFKKPRTKYAYMGIVSVMILLLLYFQNQISIVRKGIGIQMNSAQERRNFLASVKYKYPVLPERVMLYFTGSQDFNAEGNRVPFQQGPGYTLMVWYYKTGTIPREFLTEDFLWDMMSQGYKERGNKGFGYFRTYEALNHEVEKNNFPVKNVLSFYYDAKNKKIIDISGEIQASLSARPITK